MTTFNTGNPIGSTDTRDLSDNAENFDVALGTLSPTWVDRLGNTRDSFEGRLSKGSFYRVGTFAAGYTLTNMRQTLEYSGVEYSWSGSFPKVVAAGATPATSGGIGDGAWVDRTDVTLRSELLSGSSYLRNGLISLRDFVSVKDYGAVGDGIEDDTLAIQTAIDNNYDIFFPAGVYKISSVTVQSGKRLHGTGNKHLYLRNSGGITLAQVKTLGGSWIYGTSLATPAINAACNSVSSGLHVEGLCFYQEHLDYSNPTDYPYQISDENSTSFWSGVTVKNCMFINSNHGINLTKSERTDISDINGDFFRRGINIATNNDVSRMNRIHIWSFAQSTLASAFRQTEQSDYAIYIDDADEMFVSEIFIWDRLFGIYTTKLWGTLRSITLDAVGVPIVIDSPISFATMVTDIKINANNPSGTQRAAIYITGTALDEASVIVDCVSCWSGGMYQYSVDSTVEINCSGLICKINNVNHKYANKTGVLITNAKEVSLTGHIFQNYFPNQDSSVGVLTTVGIRNESTTCKLLVSGIKAGVLRFLFDGYYDFTSFLDTAPSLISTNQVMQYLDGSIIASGLSTVNNMRYFRYANNVNSVAYSGLRCVGGIKNNKSVTSGSKYIIAAVYKNITAIDAPPTLHKFVGFPSYSGEDNFLILDTALHTATRCAIQVYKPGGKGDLIPSAFGQTLNGAVDIYGVWMCNTDFIAVGFDDNNNYLPYAPSSTAGYHVVGDYYKNNAPAAAGYAGWVCTAAGRPGTWKGYGVISA